MSQLIDDNRLISTYASFRAQTGATADAILVNPVLRGRFLDLVRDQVGDQAEEEPVLRQLLNLRKRSRLPRG